MKARDKGLIKMKNLFHIGNRGVTFSEMSAIALLFVLVGVTLGVGAFQRIVI